MMRDLAEPQHRGRAMMIIFVSFRLPDALTSWWLPPPPSAAVVEEEGACCCGCCCCCCWMALVAWAMG